MSHLSSWKQKEILIIAKAYPEPSKKYGETVCTGGIIKNGCFIRIYPIRFRLLEFQKKYGTWFWIRAELKKNLQDKRKF